MSASRRIDKFADEYILYRDEMEGRALATLRGDRRALNHLIRIHGAKTPVEEITSEVMDAHLKERRRDVSEQTYNLEVVALRTFFAWLAETKRAIRQGDNPMLGRKLVRTTPPKMVWLTADQVTEMISVTKRPRDRMVLCLAVGTLLRSSDLIPIQWGDLDFSDPEETFLYAKIRKTRGFDPELPIMGWLRDELLAWRAEYQRSIDRPILPTDYVLCAIRTTGRAREKGRFAGGSDRIETMVPEKPMAKAHLVVQRAAQKIGVPLYDETGKPMRIGAHTMRRSGALMIYKTQVAENDPEAMRATMSMLQHKSQVTTEKYLGMDDQRRMRNRTMFKMSDNFLPGLNQNTDDVTNISDYRKAN